VAAQAAGLATTAVGEAALALAAEDKIQNRVGSWGNSTIHMSMNNKLIMITVRRDQVLAII